MIVAVASGKGGTGKTTVAVSLALAYENGGEKQVQYLDCDVEAPNAAIFLKPELNHKQPVGLLVPEILLEKCNLCDLCGEVCAFHAILVAGEGVLVLPELCHGCGSCALNCPTGAIQERLHITGTIEAGLAGEINFAQGRLKIGQDMAAPIIRQLKGQTLAANAAHDFIILDAPPGTACPLIETVRGVDYVLLVTEPTPFGLHDLRKSVEVVLGELGIPVGVIINREGIGDSPIEAYCADYGIPVLLHLPFERQIAAAYSEGVALIEALPEYRPIFENLLRKILMGVVA